MRLLLTNPRQVLRLAASASNSPTQVLTFDALVDLPRSLVTSGGRVLRKASVTFSRCVAAIPDRPTIEWDEPLPGSTADEHDFHCSVPLPVAEYDTLLSAISFAHSTTLEPFFGFHPIGIRFSDSTDEPAVEVWNVQEFPILEPESFKVSLGLVPVDAA